MKLIHNLSRIYFFINVIHSLYFSVNGFEERFEELFSSDEATEVHNSRRRLHVDTPDMVYDTCLASCAQAWADRGK